ncbi:MAG: F0F1 ATP synthase subunit delta [Verrucomicrobiota bacterium]
MKLSRDVRKQVSALFRACFVNGNLDEAKARKILQALAKIQPRKLPSILQGLKTLIQMEIQKRTITVESAVSLPNQGDAVFAQVEKEFGPALARNYRVNEELIGGLRIQAGSTVWDGSVLQRLNSLKN